MDRAYASHSAFTIACELIYPTHNRQAAEKRQDIRLLKVVGSKPVSFSPGFSHLQIWPAILETV